VSRRLALALLATTAGLGCGPRGGESHAVPPNVALGCPVSVVGGEGDSATVTDGRLATEGAAPGDGAVVLAGPRSAIVIDLGTLHQVRALLLQASAEDVYFVETSSDGSSWRVRWRVAPVHPGPALRTRRTVLPRSAPARWIRLRPTTERPAAVSEIQVFEVAPSAWPPLDTSGPDSPLPLWPALTHDQLAVLYQALAGLLMLVVGWSVLARRRPGGAGEERARRGALVFLAVASLLAWPNLLDFHYHGFLHKWELFHYYMGAKYLPELGYTRLYACAAAVDAEDSLDLRGRLARDLRDNRLVPAVDELSRSAECRGRFSPERWRSFRKDARFFRAIMGRESWIAVRRDHGFNGTPAWAVVAGLLARLGPASRPQLVFLALLDVALVLAVFLLVGRVFGLEAAAIAAGFFGVDRLSQFGWTGGSFLRYDWLFWLVAGIAALRARRQALAGFALACSALLRIFPLFALLALALKAVAGALAERRLAPLRARLRLAVGAAIAACLLVGASSLMAGGPRIWAEFAENSAKHLSTESVNFVGLQSFLAYDGSARLELMQDPLLFDRHASWTEHVSAMEHRTRPARWVAGGAFILLLALATRGVPDWAAAVLGVGLMPMLMKLSDYYYSGLLVYATLWTLSAGAGLALTVFAWVTNVIPGLWPEVDTQYAWLSLGAVVLAVGVTGRFAWRRPGGAAEPKPRTPPAS
jgi:hypothetical protein